MPMASIRFRAPRRNPWRSEEAWSPRATTLSWPPPVPAGVDVVNKLFKKPYRIIHISAHGIFQAGKGKDARSGVVLSDGLLLTAAEIGQLEVVPDLVFLNCCFLGKVNNPPTPAYNRLAYSVARELIEIGVRAVVVAGWAVRDDAGEFFAETFYAPCCTNAKPSGMPSTPRGKLTYEDPRFSGCNTWGAYQAYGDPRFFAWTLPAVIQGEAGSRSRWPLRRWRHPSTHFAMRWPIAGKIPAICADN